MALFQRVACVCTRRISVRNVVHLILRKPNKIDVFTYVYVYLLSTEQCGFYLNWFIYISGWPNFFARPEMKFHHLSDAFHLLIRWQSTSPSVASMKVASMKISQNEYSRDVLFFGSPTDARRPFDFILGFSRQNFLSNHDFSVSYNNNGAIVWCLCWFSFCCTKNRLYTCTFSAIIRITFIIRMNYYYVMNTNWIFFFFFVWQKMLLYFHFLSIQQECRAQSL